MTPTPPVDIRLADHPGAAGRSGSWQTATWILDISDQAARDLAHHAPANCNLFVAQLEQLIRRTRREDRITLDRALASGVAADRAAWAIPTASAVSVTVTPAEWAALTDDLVHNGWWTRAGAQLWRPAIGHVFAGATR